MSERRGDLGPMSVEDYLAFDNATLARHEYVGGRVYGMSVSTARHNRIVANIHSRLRAATKHSECDAYFIELKVRAAADRIYYPDALVVSSGHEGDALIVDEPCLVVEVTSPSTRRLDHTEKLEAYRRMPSLCSYLIAEQGRRHVTLHSREPDGDWVCEVIIGTGTVSLPCINATLTLDEVYETVEFPPRIRERVGEDVWVSEDELRLY
jgi:Uma2 family endonuclease